MKEEFGNEVTGIGPMIFNPDMNVRFSQNKGGEVKKEKMKVTKDKAEAIVKNSIRSRFESVRGLGLKEGHSEEFVDKKLRGVKKTIEAFECCTEDGLDLLASPLGMLLTLLFTNRKDIPRMIEAMDEVMSQIVIERLSEMG